MLLYRIVSLFRFFFSAPYLSSFFFFFFNDTATTEIYTLSLHDALPILHVAPREREVADPLLVARRLVEGDVQGAANAEQRGGQRVIERVGGEDARDEIGRASCRERV